MKRCKASAPSRAHMKYHSKDLSVHLSIYRSIYLYLYIYTCIWCFLKLPSESKTNILNSARPCPLYPVRSNLLVAPIWPFHLQSEPFERTRSKQRSCSTKQRYKEEESVNKSRVKRPKIVPKICKTLAKVQGQSRGPNSMP